MDEQTFVLALIGIIMGATVLIVTISKITGLIRAWINRDRGYSEDEFDRLAQAFIDYKKSTERRIQNLEAIAADEKDEWKPAVSHGAIEVNERSEAESEQQSTNLRNMLRS